MTSASYARALPAPQPPRFGVLAFGDSITNGGGELQWGVPPQFWALWVAPVSYTHLTLPTFYLVYISVVLVSLIN